MRVPTWSLPAALLLTDAHQTVAKAILSPALFQKRNDLNEIFDSIDYTQDSGLARRNPQNQQQDPAMTGGSSTGSLKIGTNAAEVNATVTAACSEKLADLNSVTNPAGFAACYNILSFDPTTTQFQSDLRIYSKNDPSGQFTGIARNDILVLLNFPSSTSFKTLAKRADVQIEARQENDDDDDDNNDDDQDNNNPPATPQVAFQQFSLSGSITTPLNIGNLNDVQLASLLTPQIKLQSSSGGQTFSAEMTTDDAAFFVTGDFTQLSSRAKEVSDPNTATNAIAANKGFVLPGTTFGIFPIGLIVTSAWALMFFIAYGAGTIARFHYRSMYRKRVAMVAGRSYTAPGIGKL